jgi:hypothetical protein
LYFSANPDRSNFRSGFFASVYPITPQPACRAGWFRPLYHGFSPAFSHLLKAPPAGPKPVLSIVRILYSQRSWRRPAGQQANTYQRKLVAMRATP